MRTKRESVYNLISLIVLMAMAGILIIMSERSRSGALEGLALAQNTIIPSLLPLLIIFLTIMKSGANQILTRLFGRATAFLFNLPANTTSAIIFGLVGGYPTGALVTDELLKNDDIDKKQARRLLRFCFCGGCGFIITAVGVVTMNSLKVGVIMFSANAISFFLIGILLSFTEKRTAYNSYTFCDAQPIGDALCSATSTAVSSVLNITAYIILFSAVNELVSVPDFLMPAIEITNGICDCKQSIPLICSYLSFGGICIHLQLMPVMSRAGMRYTDFLLFRLLSAVISYSASRLLLFLFPIEQAVFSNQAQRTVSVSSVNITLSVLMVIGCFVLVLDISARKRKFM